MICYSITENINIIIDQTFFIVYLLLYIVLRSYSSLEKKLSQLNFLLRFGTERKDNSTLGEAYVQTVNV